MSVAREAVFRGLWSAVVALRQGLPSAEVDGKGAVGQSKVSSSL